MSKFYDDLHTCACISIPYSLINNSCLSMQQYNAIHPVTKCQYNSKLKIRIISYVPFIFIVQSIIIIYNFCISIPHCSHSCACFVYRKGDLDELTKHGSLHNYLLHMHQNGHKPIGVFWWGQQRIVSICSPEMFKDVIHLTDRPSELITIPI